MTGVWYFAYGSNMQRATFCGRRGIEFVRAMAGRAPGWRLVLDKPPLVPIGESFANIVPDPDAEVHGVLYEVSAGALEMIDLTEGVLIGNYVRRTISVTTLGERCDVEAATLVSDRRDAALCPSTRYMGLLIEGALEHGLPAEYIAFLRAVPARAETEAAVAIRPMLDDAMAAMRAWRR